VRISQLSGMWLLTSPVFLGATLLVSAPAIAGENPVSEGANSQAIATPITTSQVSIQDALVETPNQLEQIQQYSNETTEAGSLGQITNASQFRDVQPSDWAYEPLDRIVQKYGCLVGYPDGTYRGNRALSRYEFAAGLNACLRQVEALIASQPDSVSRTDFEALQRLTEEFRTELATLGTRVDNLEGRTQFLEDHQFSTTTKLAGEVIFGIADAFGEGAGDEVHTVFHDRVRLNFLTSFTGKDRLRTRLQAGNAVPLLSAANIPAAQRTNEGRFTYDGSNDNRNDNGVLIDLLDYRFPIGKNLSVDVFANGALHHHYADTVNPYFEGLAGGNNAISRFAERNPIYRIGPSSAGVGVNYKLSDAFKVDLGYLSNTANNPGTDAGVFNGNYSALGQVIFGSKFKIGFTYIHAYENDLSATDLTGRNPNRLILGGTGTNLANLNRAALASATTLPASAFNRPVVSNSYGLEASLPISSKFVINGWVGKTDARIIGLGDADIWNFALGLALPDLGKKGNLGGILVGAEPTLRGLQVPGTENFRRDFAYHVEGFYRYQVTKNVSVTPGVIWLTAPNQNADNNDVVIGLLRTTFTF